MHHTGDFLVAPHMFRSNNQNESISIEFKLFSSPIKMLTSNRSINNSIRSKELSKFFYQKQTLNLEPQESWTPKPQQEYMAFFTFKM